MSRVPAMVAAKTQQAAAQDPDGRRPLQAILPIPGPNASGMMPRIIKDLQGSGESTTPSPTGMTVNAVGDLQVFVSALVTNMATFAVCLSIFMVLRVRYPIIYSGNVLKGTAPRSPDVNCHYSWFEASISTTLQDNIDHVGLDQAMLIEFSQLALRICVTVGAPMVFIIGSMNCAFGGRAAGQDHLSYLSFGNVQNGSWLYWLHALVVWGVVLTVTHLIYEAQRRFLKLRWTWLRRMAPKRANTVLVSGIPEGGQSDEKIREFFEIIFPGDKIKSTYCVKDTSALCALRHQLSEAKDHLFEAEARKDEDSHSVVRSSWCGGAKLGAAEYYNERIAELEPQVKAMREKIKEASKQVGEKGYNCSFGFVTFNDRCDAEMALRLDNISTDQQEWLIEIPPCPTDVLWADLMQDPTAEAGRMVIGYLFVAGLYFAYMPMVVGITNIAKIVDLGPLQPLWSGIAPTFGLTLMVSFLPTFIIWIFKLFFTLKADAWAQHELQAWYFWFNMVFVVMATAVGQNVRDFTRTLATSPFDIFGLLADTMPYSTHFYMNFLVLQWVTHAMNMLRYIPLTKFKMFSAIYEEEEAAKKAEPEDQDYFGLGSRHAQWTTNLVIGIVFGTLSPPMYFLTFVNFAICRVLYGYLIPYAETRKPDLGGVFWVRSLKHILYGMLVYAMLMTGVLGHRASSAGPMLIAAPTLGYLWWSLRRFDTAFSWEKLPFFELMSDEGKAQDASETKRDLVGEYVQEELLDS